MLVDRLKQYFNTNPRQILTLGNWLFIAAGLLTIVWRFVTATLWGTLIALVLIYAALTQWGSTRPLTAGELGDWISQLDPSATATLLATILTILGFLVAFRSAHSAWKREQLGTLRLAAAEEVHVFFQETSDALIDMELYVDQLLDLKRDIDEGAELEQLQASARWVNTQSQPFLAARWVIREKSVKVHALRAKHELVVSGRRFASSMLGRAVSEMEVLTSAIWFPTPPVTDDEISILKFIANFDGIAWRNFKATAVGARYRILVASGGVRGALLSEFLQPNISILKRMRTMGRAIPEMVDEYQQKQ